MSARGSIIEHFIESRNNKEGIKNFNKFELLNVVLIRTENVRGESKFIKQPKTKTGRMVLQKHRELTEKNGIKIVKKLEEAPIIKMENSNRIVTEIHSEVPIIYYLVMLFGLASVIFSWDTSVPIYRSIMFGGGCVFFVALIGVLEIKLKKIKRLNITD